MPIAIRTPDCTAPPRRVLHRCAVIIGLCAATLGASPAHADPSVPWTPSASGRHYLALLSDEAGLALPLNQWPLPGAAVARALDALPAALPPELDAALRHVRHELQRQGHGQLAITLRERRDALAGFGDDATPGSFIALRTPAFSSEQVVMQLGGRIDSERREGEQRAQPRLDGSVLATEWGGVQLHAWSHRSWWGPGWQSSLALGNNAPPFTAIGLQRAAASRSESPWLSWLGPWNLEFFVARLEDNAGALLVGSRLSLKPFSQVELGVTRVAQWGGLGRPRSLRSFLRMLVGHGSNPDNPAEQAEDPSSAVGGFDIRARCPSGLRCAGYAQFIGEDQAGGAPSKYLSLYGLETWSGDGRQRVFAEFTETSCKSIIGQTRIRGCAYRNAAYPAGYTSAGRWIGANLGPDSHLLTLGWLHADSGSSLRLHKGRIGARIGSSAATDDPRSAGTLLGLGARHTAQWRMLAVTGEFDWTRVRAAAGRQVDARIGVNLRVDLD